MGSRTIRAAQLLALVAAIVAFLGAPARSQDRPTVDDYRPSPHKNTRSSRTIRYVVIHTVQGSYNGALSWFQNSSSRVSAHYTVSKTGRLGQSVEEKDIAWHAGNSTYNAMSVGIEHEGWVTDPNNYTDAMLQKSAALTRYLCARYAIPIDRQHIIGHVEVPGATHSDPGKYFPWDFYIALVKGQSTTTPPPPPSTTPSVKGVEVTANSLNVRSSPWGTILGTVPSGRKLVQVGSQDGWAKIWYEGRTAWVYQGYTRAMTSGTADEVDTDALNVRTGPGTGYSVVDSASRGERYVRESTSGSWRQIHFGRRLRWVHGDYTKSLPIR